MSTPWQWGDDSLPVGWPSDYGIPTLGLDLLAWSETELIQPDGEQAGQPWRWRESQGRFISWFYALDDDGNYLFRRGQIVLPKGAGKSPVAAALAVCNLLGPVVFDGWDAHREPVGRPHPSPRVQLAAVSQDQADNTMSLAIAMVGADAPISHHTMLDPGVTRIRAPHGLLWPVTASAPSREGDRSTFAVLDETHLWTSSNGGQRLAATIRRNLGKMGGRSIETTNTWLPGSGSVAEGTAAYGANLVAGQAVSGSDQDYGVLRWHPMPIGFTEDDLHDKTKLRDSLTYLYSDSPWVSVDRIMAEIYDQNQDPRDSLRFYLNLITASSTAWISEPEWLACRRDGLSLRDGDEITLGFDGSRGRIRGKPDATALIGCRISDGAVFQIGVWEAPPVKATWATWQPPISEIEAALTDVFTRFQVHGFYADPGKDWRSHIDAWEARWGSSVTVRASAHHPFEWWMTGGRSGLVQRAIEDVEGAIRNHDLGHAGDYDLTRHVLNAHRRLSHGKLALGKNSDYSDHKIDAAVAMVLAWQARLDALARPSQPTQPMFIPARIR